MDWKGIFIKEYTQQDLYIKSMKIENGQMVGSCFFSQQSECDVIGTINAYNQISLVIRATEGQEIHLGGIMNYNKTEITGFWGYKPSESVDIFKLSLVPSAAIVSSLESNNIKDKVEAPLSRYRALTDRPMSSLLPGKKADQITAYKVTAKPARDSSVSIISQQVKQTAVTFRENTNKSALRTSRIETTKHLEQTNQSTCQAEHIYSFVNLSASKKVKKSEKSPKKKTDQYLESYNRKLEEFKKNFMDSTSINVTASNLSKTLLSKSIIQNKSYSPVKNQSQKTDTKKVKVFSLQSDDGGTVRSLKTEQLGQTMQCDSDTCRIISDGLPSRLQLNNGSFAGQVRGKFAVYNQKLAEVKQKQLAGKVKLEQTVKKISSVTVAHKGLQAKKLLQTALDTEQSQRQQPFKQLPKIINQQSDVLLAAMKFVDKIIEEGNPWTDPDFPPSIESLVGQKVEKYAKLKEYNDWKRCSDIFQAPVILNDQIGASDVKQQALGDCYFLSLLSAMAMNQNNIKERFVTKTTNKAGIYLLTYFVNGVETPVILDDFLPTQFGQAAFGCTLDNKQLWVSLLEKGWAKLKGSYQQIVGLTANMAAAHVFGIHNKIITHKEIPLSDQLWQKLMKATQRNFNVTVSIDKRTQQISDDGLVSDHAYTFISMHTIQVADGKSERILRLRNPWGTKQWKGDYSDTSEQLTTSVLSQIPGFSKEDTTFLFPFSQMMEKFDTTSIYFSNDPQKYSKTTCDINLSDSQLACVNFTLDDEADLQDYHFSIGCIQNCDRLKSYVLDGDANAFQLSEFNIILLKCEQNKPSEYIKAVYGGVYDYNFSLILKKGRLVKGDYLIVIHPLWHPSVAKFQESKQLKVIITSATTVSKIQETVEQAALPFIKSAFVNLLSGDKFKVQREFYTKGSHADYDDQVYKVFVSYTQLKCFCYVLYTKNESEFVLKEDRTISTEGFASFGRKDFNIELLPGEYDVALFFPEKEGIGILQSYTLHYKTNKVPVLQQKKAQQTAVDFCPISKFWHQMSESEQKDVYDQIQQILHKYQYKICNLQPRFLTKMQTQLKTGKQQQSSVLVLNLNPSVINDSVTKQLTSDIGKGFGPYLEIDIQFDDRVSVGSDFVTIKNAYNFSKKQKFSIVHNPGEVILLYFWTTQCGPCQTVMERNIEMQKRNGTRWGKSVRIICISCDQSAKIAYDHLQKFGWTSLENYHVTTTGAYKITGYPSLFLIDKKGKVVFDNWQSEKLENDIETLLKDGVIDSPQRQQKQDEYFQQESIKTRTLFEQFQQLSLAFVQSNQVSFKLLTDASTLGLTKTTLIDPDTGVFSFSSNFTQKIGARSKVEQEKAAAACLNFWGSLTKSYSIRTSKCQWHELTEQEKQDIKAQLSQIYKEAGSPVWLQMPKFLSKVKLMPALGTIEINSQVQVTGVAPLTLQTKVNDVVSRIQQVLNQLQGVIVDVKSKPDVGDSYIPIKNARSLFKDQLELIEHQKGQILVLDFWATWCGPCQGPMQHNKEMLQKYGSLWGNTVRIVSLSVDQQLQTAKDHVTKKAWNNFEHFHVGSQGEAVQQYGVNSLPTILLVDKEGKIAFFGSPNNSQADLDSDINELFAGKTLDYKRKTCQREKNKDFQNSESDLGDNEIENKMYEVLLEFKYNATQTEGSREAYFEMVKLSTYNVETSHAHFSFWTGSNEVSDSLETTFLELETNFKLQNNIRDQNYQFHELSVTGRKQLLQDFQTLYKEANYPNWLNPLELQVEINSEVTTGKPIISSTIKISGTGPYGQQQQVDSVVDKIHKVFSSHQVVTDCRVAEKQQVGEIALAFKLTNLETGRKETITAPLSGQQMSLLYVQYAEFLEKQVTEFVEKDQAYQQQKVQVIVVLNGNENAAEVIRQIDQISDRIDVFCAKGRKGTLDQLNDQTGSHYGLVADKINKIVSQGHTHQAAYEKAITQVLNDELVDFFNDTNQKLGIKQSSWSLEDLDQSIQNAKTAVQQFVSQNKAQLALVKNTQNRPWVFTVSLTGYYDVREGNFTYKSSYSSYMTDSKDEIVKSTNQQMDDPQIWLLPAK